MTGILRGFDPFMNIVVDESIEETKEGHKKNIGMVVSYLIICFSAFIFDSFEDIVLGLNPKAIIYIYVHYVVNIMY